MCGTIGGMTISLDEPHRGYLAGILDGEGTIYIRHRKARTEFPVGDRRRWKLWTLGVRVNNTDGALIQWLHDHFGGNVYFSDKPRIQGHKPMHFWTITGRNTGPVLRAALPYMIIKKRHAEIAIEFRETMGMTGRAGHPPEVNALREMLHAEIKALNKRGAAPWVAEAA
jgi:hypothetical protein